MKRITSIAALIVAAIAIITLAAPTPAQAQTGLGTPQTVFSTAAISGKVLTASTSSSTTTNVVNVAGKDLAIEVAAQEKAAGSSNLVVAVQKSVGGTVWDPMATYTFTLNGTTAITTTTNLTVNAVPKVRLIVTTTSLAANAVTNATIKVYSK